MRVGIGMTSRRILCALIASCAFSGATVAGVVSTTGVVQISPPASVKAEQSVNNQAAQWFFERTTTLTSDLNVDILTPGTFNTTNPTALGAIAAGTAIESYFFTADQTGTTQRIYTGSLTFSSPILGLLLLNGDSTSRLHLSDAILGLSTTEYDSANPSNGLFDGRATNSQFESVTLSADRRTLSFDLSVGNFSDQIRIVTAVPEPSSVALVSVALFAGMTFRQRKRH